MHQPVEDAVSVDPWNLWLDAPFVHTAKSLDTFLLFLQDEEAKEYEIVRMGCYSMTLRLVGSNGSEVYFEAYSTSANREKREGLVGTLSEYPSGMPKHSRAKLSGIVGAFFGL